MRILILAAVLAAGLLIGPAGGATGPAPAIEWEHLYGGADFDEASSIAALPAGGWIVAGHSYSSGTGDVADLNNGRSDIWLAALGPRGALTGQALIGGEESEYPGSVRSTADGGCVVTGTSWSSESWDVHGANHGQSDLWMVKLGPAGMVQGERLLGGSEADYGEDGQQTADGGYILAGSSMSSEGGDVTGENHGGNDLWVVKLSAAGGVEWDRLLGGSRDETANAVRQTADGGYIVAGASTSSENGDVTGENHGDHDLWVVKLSAAGGVEWNRLLGGSGEESDPAVRQTADGGYIVAGASTSSASGDVRGVTNGDRDVWVVKLGPAGAVQDERLFGGSGNEGALSVNQTPDGGFILAGWSYSSQSGDVRGANHGYNDVWVVRLGPAGAVRWQRLLGGSGYEGAFAVEKAPDGGYILAGHSSSSADGDVGEMTRGGFDYWVVRLGLDPPPVIAVPPVVLVATDADGDDLWEDLNGNGRADFADVVLYFNSMTWIAANEPISAFDYNANGRIDFADVVWLFNHL